MRYTAINDKLDPNSLMLQHRFMAALDDTCHEFFGTIFRDLLLGLVADTSGLLNGFQNLLSVNRRKNMKPGFDYPHLSFLLTMYFCLY
jgi:hypothetical protein